MRFQLTAQAKRPRFFLRALLSHAHVKRAINPYNSTRTSYYVCSLCRIYPALQNWKEVWSASVDNFTTCMITFCTGNSEWSAVLSNSSVTWQAIHNRRFKSCTDSLLELQAFSFIDNMNTCIYHVRTLEFPEHTAMTSTIYASLDGTHKWSIQLVNTYIVDSL